MASQDPRLDSVEGLDWNTDSRLTFNGSFPDNSNGRYGTERLKVGRCYCFYPDARTGDSMHQNPDCSTASIDIFAVGDDKW